MNPWTITSCISILIVVLCYYLNFGLHGDLADKTDIWGQFGDYFGGVLNPILSFISIVLLIRSLNFQREANESLINEGKRQEQLEELRKFELKFYNSIETQKSMFDSFELEINNKTYKSAKAVTQLENIIFDLIDNNYSKKKIQNVIAGIDTDDNIFSVVRRFCLILKVTTATPEKNISNEYKTILINFTDFKLLCLISIATIYFDWDCIEDIRQSNILLDHGMDKYLSGYSSHNNNLD
jgi:uncharacterized membrane protein